MKLFYEKKKIYFLLILISCMLAYYSIHPLRYDFYSLPFGYIRIGDYLRDTHGINWYYMDYGGYLMTGMLLLTSIYSAIGFFLAGKLVNTSKLKTSKRKNLKK